MSFPHPSRPGRTRDGFTAIEMMVVISVMILLVAMSLPGLFPALKKGRVSDAAEAIMRVASQARQMARLRPQPVGAAVSYYGVSVVVPATGPAYAVLTYGSQRIRLQGEFQQRRASLQRLNRSSARGRLHADGSGELSGMVLSVPDWFPDQIH